MKRAVRGLLPFISVVCLALSSISCGGGEGGSLPPQNSGGDNIGSTTFTISPIAIAPGAGDLLARNGDIFWTYQDRNSNVVKFSAINGSITKLALRMERPRDLAVIGERILWTDLSGGAQFVLRAFNRIDRSIVRLFQPPACGTPGPLVVDNNNVYWAIAACANSMSGIVDTIVKIPLNGRSASTLVTTQSGRGIQSIVVDSTHVYWSEGGILGSSNSSLRRVAKTGGFVQDLVFEQDEFIGDIALNESFIVFSDSNLFNSYRLKKVPKNGGEVATLAIINAGATTDYLRALTIDNTNIFWIEETKVKTMSLNGGFPIDLVTGQDKASKLAVIGNEIFWIEFPGPAVGSTGRIKKVSKLGGPVTTVLDNLDFPETFVYDNGDLYWNEANPFVDGSGRVATSSVAGGSISTVLRGIWRENPPFSVDDLYMYVGDGHVLKKISLQGGMAEQLAIGSGFITNVVTDGSFVFWAETNAVRRVAVGGGPVTELSSYTGKEEMRSVSVANGYAYWIERVGFDEAIKKLPLIGGPVATILSGARGLFHLIADETNVYILQGGPSFASIRKMPVGGGPLITLVPIAGPASMSLDASNLYWANEFEVGRIDKTTGVTKFYDQGLDNRGAVTVDDTSVYWYANNFIWKANPK